MFLYFETSCNWFPFLSSTETDELAAGLGRLKNLGLGLGDEIVRQNDDIDRITHKTGNVDTRIAGVNKDVNKILYRWKLADSVDGASSSASQCQREKQQTETTRDMSSHLWA